MDDTEDKGNLTIFTNLMHEFDTARVGIRKTISELNRAVKGADVDIERVNAYTPRLVEQLDLLDVLFEFLRIELNPDLITYATKSEINIHGIFWRALRHFSAQLQEKHLKWTLDKVSGFVVEASPSLAILPIVLIDNAIKYAPKQDHLYVNLDPTSRTVTIESHGPRIGDDEMKVIFDRGFRGQYARLTHSGGQGLGLYMARRICDAHGFTIKATQTVSSYSIGGVTYATVAFVVRFNENVSLR